MSNTLHRTIAGVLILCAVSWGQDSKDDFDKRIQEIDKVFLNRLGELAKKYHAEKEPEAAHFFAECLLGLGQKDAEITALRRAYESDCYTGKLRGGKVLGDTLRIDERLDTSEDAYKTVVDELLAALRKGDATEEARRMLHGCVVKYSLARDAGGYIRAVQEINRLRSGMGLRAVLWDFEMSERFVLAGWYMADTGFYTMKGPEEEKHAFFSPALEFARKQSVRLPYRHLHEMVDYLRASALTRLDMLNPDARRVWLGQRTDGQKLSSILLYRLPKIGYRDDIPTPSRRYSGKTESEDTATWFDTEDMITVNDRKILYVRYPYEGETDAPYSFNNREYGWADSESRFLAKAGLPVIILFNRDCKLEAVEFLLKDPSGKPLRSRIYREDDKRAQFHVRLPLVLLMPERPLEPGRAYRVEFRCTVDGVPFEKTWTFNTRAQ